MPGIRLSWMCGTGPVGQNFVTKMSDALARADRVVALFSAAYFERERYTTEEWSASLTHIPGAGEGRLVPVRVEKVPAEAVPPVLRPLIACDVSGLDGDQARRVLMEAVAGPRRPDGEPVFPGSRVAGDRQQPEGPRPPTVMPAQAQMRQEIMAGRDAYTAARDLTIIQQHPTVPGAESLQPGYKQSPPYWLQHEHMIFHRIGVRNLPGNPEALGVQLHWTSMSPRPRTDLGYPPVVPQAVPMLGGGDPSIGISLPAGQEELWVIATTATDAQGVMTVGAFYPDWPGWRGTPWYFEPDDRWRFSYRIVAENLPGVAFSIVMTAANGYVRCDLEG
jgi:hypothetical protein